MHLRSAALLSEKVAPLQIHTGSSTKGSNMAPAQNLLFCTLAGQDVGYGHLSRCLSLADWASAMGWRSHFLIVGNGAEIARRRGHGAVDLSRHGTLPTILSKSDAAATIGILDAAHPSILINRTRAAELVSQLRTLAGYLVAIDSLGSMSFAALLPEFPVDAFAVPYVGSREFRYSAKCVLAGPEYAILGTEYERPPKRIIRPAADRILVTLGGSDPRSLTPVVLRALGQIEQALRVRVVLGPLFSDRLIAEINETARHLSHHVEYLSAPQGLSQHMFWSDLAVAASGLVKYEFAATGTPSAILSIDDIHHAANTPFSETGAHLDIGVTHDPAKIALSIQHLLNDPVGRNGMAQKGQQLVDGEGARRLLTVLVKRVNCNSHTDGRLL